MSLDGGPAGTGVERLAMGGDRAAFSALMRQHKGHVWRLIRRYVADDSDAYDVLQETFVSAWRRIDSFDPARPFSVWISTIAINRCRDHARRRKVRRAFSVPIGPGDDAVDPGVRAEAAAIGRQGIARLYEEIGRLPAGLRDPLILTSLEGHSHQEAASILGLSAKAVELRTRRARGRLAARLSRDILEDVLDGAAAEPRPANRGGG